MKVGKFKIRNNQAERLDYMMDHYIKSRKIKFKPNNSVGRPKKRD